jgi:O-acetyl-ADP-ribose deacetylase (regulator of RNase III)
MSAIRYIKGDATQPQTGGNKVIAHVCNDLGGWGKGFVLAVSKRWPEPEAAYRAWHRDRAHNDFGLGALQIVQVETYVWVANMVAQHGMTTGSAGPPIRYEAVRACLCKLAAEAKALGASVHMPRIGCGLAGGRWERVEPIIAEELTSQGVDVTVYDFG